MWNLTPYGKVVIVKSLIYSKITHILLSLPKPSEKAFIDIQSLIDSFLWNNKPPKFRREILEAELAEGVMKLHNLKIFSMALKAGWIKRYLSSIAKWTSLPDYYEFGEICTYSENYIDRIYEITYNPFWRDVLDAIRHLWKTNRMIIPENRVLTPLWLNLDLQIPTKRSWKEKGILIVSDVLDRNNCTLKLLEFETMYNLKINFLEYGSFCAKITNYLNWKYIAEGSRVQSCYSYLNVLLSKDRKRVSFTYKQLIGKHGGIIVNACEKMVRENNK